MPITLLSATLSSLSVFIVSVEVDSGGGDFGRISIVGLPDAAASEAKERVKSAIRNSGLDYPRRGITINLAPADLKKKGPLYDLAIAIGILAIKNRLYFKTEKDLFIGELSLDGKIKGVKGALPIALKASEENIERIFLADDNILEVSLVKNIKIIPLKNLAEAIAILSGKAKPREIKKETISIEKEVANNDIEKSALNFLKIKGQEKAKRALEIMAAGKHNLILSGPPGSGKSALAKTAIYLMPETDEEEQLEIMKIYSACGLIDKIKNNNLRPFRFPHHSSSAKAIIGGGNNLRPGEISLAHRGLLFLDELPEFSRDVLEALREPLEEGVINISRTGGSEIFPARFTLIAAMNPCPCGFYRDKEKQCSCTRRGIELYRKKISGPILDRIDLFVDTERFDWEDNAEEKKEEEEIEKIKIRIEMAVKKQRERYIHLGLKSNTEVPGQIIEVCGNFSPESLHLARVAAKNLHLSMRSYFKVLKVARTIADLAQNEFVSKENLAEALQYRESLSRLGTND